VGLLKGVDQALLTSDEFILHQIINTIILFDSGLGLDVARVRITSPGLRGPDQLT